MWVNDHLYELMTAFVASAFFLVLIIVQMVNENRNKRGDDHADGWRNQDVHRK